MEFTDARAAVLDAVADALPDPIAHRRHVLVGIDGVDGSGKTTFADELESTVAARGVRCIRISLDDFHAPREVRHRRGSDSPEGLLARLVRLRGVSCAGAHSGPRRR